MKFYHLSPQGEEWASSDYSLISGPRYSNDGSNDLLITCHDGRVVTSQASGPSGASSNPTRRGGFVEKKSISN